ncbi:MAG: zinc ribbon domain-containing protein [Ardenticatenaceae bacterium]|nr:zinc ribbon domain-containing protein [Ardenticatenaceae bacterium]
MKKEWQAAGGKWHGSLRVLVILLMGWLWAQPVAAQGAATLDTLSVEIWPDYDQTDVLVLLTGQLAASMALPATLTIPLPPNADINAVARITSDGMMTDDIDFTQTADSVTLTTPDPQFRVEYYYPYTVDGDQHSFSFNWTAALAVDQMTVSVQQPVSAAEMTTNPAATAVSTRQLDGLTYHALPPETIPAGQAYSVSVTYQMTSPLLTVAQLQSQNSGGTAVTTVTTVPEATPNWALYLAAVGTALIGIAMFWQAYSKRNNQPKRRRPAPNKQAASAKFCHNCGERRHPGDQFCRSCGTALK